jgi:hypothetical protein
MLIRSHPDFLYSNLDEAFGGEKAQGGIKDGSTQALGDIVKKSKD